MPKLSFSKMTLAAFAFFLSIAAQQNTAFAKVTFPMDRLESFARRHSCGNDQRIVNNTQHLAWMEVLRNVALGGIAPELLTECEASPYGFLTEVMSGEADPAQWIESRRTLVSRIDAPSPGSDEPQKDRIQQGYAAADYVFSVYLLCLAQESCFDTTLKEDGYAERICPNPAPPGADVTSPDFFEVTMYRSEGDTRQFLPYLLTNCRLRAISIARDGHFPIFSTIERIVEDL
ncbi:MAG: hypothetical protein HWE35_17845 [Rhodobacteraceae bacterium]|nr:hypothetical protein [Paracoccaceae bacterium]